MFSLNYSLSGLFGKTDVALRYSFKFLVIVFSSPVRKYRKSYCSHLGVGVGVAQMLKFLVKVFVSLYLLNI